MKHNGCRETLKDEKEGPSWSANESGIPKRPADLERVYHSHNREVNWFLRAHRK